MPIADEWSSIGRTATDAVLAGLGYDLTAEYRDILEHAGLHRDRPVLELATGTGRTIAVLTRLGYRVVTGDCTLDQISAARTRVGPDYLGRVRFVLLAMEQLPLATASVASLVSINTIHELARPVPCVAEMARVLAPGGRLVIADFNDAGFAALQHVHQTLHGRNHPRGSLPMAALPALLPPGSFHLREIRTPLLTADIAVRIPAGPI
jgi:ubiquinone/menaquinone biosynthesis C-methylase UbiE